ncbi:MAG: UDP-2,3-diacylglucosamine diphosphatase LpxI [Gemmataceae bacterium]
MTRTLLNLFRPQRTTLPPGTAIGLVACAGQFPVRVAEKAREIGVPLICVGMAGMADPRLKELSTEFHWLRRMSIGFAARKFRQAGVQRMTFAGKFQKHVLFRPWRWLQMLPDWRTFRLWQRLRNRNRADDNIMHAIIDEFLRDGIQCVSALDLCPELLVREGLLTKRKPTAGEERDIQFGWTLAKQMGGLDVGQSVAVREQAVLAVEAIEGTDRCILRAGELCGKSPFTVVKVAKPNQDMRFDVPTVGPTTIESMRKSGGRVLAIEAGKTIIIDEKETIAEADRLGMTLISIQNPPGARS